MRKNCICAKPEEREIGKREFSGILIVGHV